MRGAQPVAWAVLILMLVGALLHDASKVDELCYDREFAYSDEGQLIGHVVMAVGLLESKVREAERLSGEPVPRETVLRLKHMIVSHHGEYDFGSPKLPMTLEAVALYCLDNLDAKLHPLYDEYWAGKNADLSKITVPAFVVASWTDHGLHNRGTIEGFKQISSKEKWLIIHGRKKWWHFYLPENVEKQRQFFDRFLRGIVNHVKDWPRVTIEVREGYYRGETRTENEWPASVSELLLNPG